MVKLANIFSDGMVLQREKNIAIWGSAEAGEKVTVSIQGQSIISTTDESGNWRAELYPMTASEKEILIVSAGSETLVLNDVAIGEVWIAGGQSNMEFPLCYEKHYSEESNFYCDNIRFFDVPKLCFQGQGEGYDYSNVGIWRRAEGDSLKYFSAIGYYFEKELEKNLNVPVGIIGCNWGGTRSCAWMKEESVVKVGEPWIRLYEDSMKDIDREEYWKMQRMSPMNYTGNPNMDQFSAYVMPETHTMEEVVAYFTKMVEEESQSGDSALKNMSEAMMAGYSVPEPKTKPGCLFEHMVRKIVPYTVRGVLWYQGENDDIQGLQALYADMLKGLIQDWRTAWEDENLPFLIVQLPGFGKWMQIENMDFTTLRRGQEQAANELNNVYLASISDAGEEFDVHPKDKKVVGHRLALLARNHIYKEEVVCEAPRVKEVLRDGKKIKITFENAGKALKVLGNTLQALEVKRNNEIIPSIAYVNGTDMEIYLEDDTDDSVQVEFAQGKWYRVNLYNEDGIPAIPFAFIC